jgi:hypothetical protein
MPSESIDSLLSCIEDLLATGNSAIIDSIAVDFVEEMEMAADLSLLFAVLPRMGPRLRSLVRPGIG